MGLGQGMRMSKYNLTACLKNLTDSGTISISTTFISFYNSIGFVRGRGGIKIAKNQGSSFRGQALEGDPGEVIRFSDALLNRAVLLYGVDDCEKCGSSEDLRPYYKRSQFGGKSARRIGVLCLHCFPHRSRSPSVTRPKVRLL